MQGNVQENVQALNSTIHEGRVWDHAPESLDADPILENNDICNEDFKNVYEIVSDFRSDDDTYNYTEEEENENFGDDEDDMSIQIYTVIRVGVKNSILTIQGPRIL